MGRGLWLRRYPKSGRTARPNLSISRASRARQGLPQERKEGGDRREEEKRRNLSPPPPLHIHAVENHFGTAAVVSEDFGGLFSADQLALEFPTCNHFHGFQKATKEMVKNKKGTTTLLLHLRQGVIVSADSRASMDGCVSLLLRTRACTFSYIVIQGSDSYFYEISKQLDLGVKNLCLGSSVQQRKTYHNLTIAEPPIAVPLSHTSCGDRAWMWRFIWITW
ncbi:hypothetical protein TRIUR3_22098 [Triticum urartu]|uniref:Uncharacterized protein n=1 Tax=Triticum urartu TaxID=4572 RepID=M7ZV79_TRIUA|nr:hypothetical protein TRIUR3_22098 [Triticum urartu]